MNTNKLGLKIVSIQQGYNDLLEINGSAEWTSKVWDLRTDLTELGNLQKGSNILFVTSIDTGTLLTVARPTDGRIGDCIAALVYVPFRLAITGQQLSQVIDFVSSGLGQVTLDRDAFQKEFSKTYDINPLDALFLTSEEKRDKAFRYYGKGTKYTLSEILGKLNQPEYRKYKSVVLLDKESNIVAKGTDLTDTPLANMLIMAPPAETCGFVPYIGGKPFIAPVFVGSTEKVQIVLKKAGYKDVSRTLAATEKLVLTPHDKMRPVEVGAIKVWDEATRRPVEGCRISINGQPLPAYVSDGDRNQASIKVEAPGYQTYRATVDLDRNNGIMLKKTTRVYVFQFRLKNGDDCRFSIETLNELVEVPFRGYESEAPIREKVVNYLEYKPATGGVKRTVIIALVALLLGCGLGWGLSMLFAGEPEKITSEEVTPGGKQPGSNNNPGGEDGGTDNGGNAAGGSNPTPPTGGATEGDGAAEDKELKDAIAYLDKAQWDKTEMDKIKLLEGFFEKVNTFNYDAVKEYENEFNGSDNYKDVLGILYEVKTKDIAVSEIYDKSINKSRSITIESFVKYVKDKDKDRVKTKSSDGGDKGGTDGANKKFGN